MGNIWSQLGKLPVAFDSMPALLAAKVAMEPVIHARLSDLVEVAFPIHPERPELVARKIEHGPQITISQTNRAQINGAAFDSVQVLAGRQQIECSSRTLVQLVLPTKHRVEGQSAERAEPRLGRA